ncbi:MAG: nuclear transport factor 2 family protein [Dehalococcoidia bacterium]
MTLALLVATAACGGDDAGGPTQRPTPTPVPVPSLAGADDEAQVRHTIEQFGYYIDQDRFDDLCTLYTPEVLEASSCDSIKFALTNAVAGQTALDISARIPTIDSIQVVGDEATASYTFCIDAGAGERCAANVAQLVKTADGWRISG